MKKHNVAILYGGKSGEHDVSLLSASSVERHLDKKKYNIHLIGITLEGLWYYQHNYTNSSQSLEIVRDESKLISLIPGKGIMYHGQILDIDFIFPILHGTFGEDGTLQGLLDIIDIPYAGSGMEGSFMAMDKEYAKIVWEKEGLPVVPFISIKKHTFIDNPNEIEKQINNKFNYPIFVKPVKTGSSVGVSRVDSSDKLLPALKNAFNYDHKVLIEPAINAREIECSVIGNNYPKTFSLGEIAPSHEFYDYEAKYIDPNGAKLIIPAILTENQKEEIKEIARKAYIAINCKGFSRVDFFLDIDTNSVMLNEINTIPGFTNVSMFSMLCAEDGLNYSDLLDKIFEYGQGKYREQQSIQYNHKG
ncbi:D-alanine--D-alanine ligase [Thiospirochaeta perfilievii]|uniref:D-alanine--D-alanine ligase n=1 Tax=Thiospirochaeta perfilievii TaxID=252967 RepID=A0A5C1Q9Z5_9SPIO|nr:D-alanine--D-alanine ligase family protein [Thiospirochaeta perfilievii]QEN04158.1 D-alanine--D-alanine ligase [Thiospirochaeta perfilievii]